MRKEAVLYSQIEGTQSPRTELLPFEADEAPGIPVEDVRDVSRYVQALRYGAEQLGAGMPLCLRRIREANAQSMADGRGSRQAPGDFCRTQTGLAKRVRELRDSYRPRRTNSCGS